MPRITTNRVPSYRLHRQSGQAIVTLNGRDFLLGKHDTPESRRRYDQVIAEWIANGRQLPHREKAITIAELIELFWNHCKEYYRHPDGTPTGEVSSIRHALRPLLDLYPDLPAAEFSPLKLKALRDVMIERGWCRKSVNAQVKRVRRMFRWATENEHVSGEVYHALQAVAGLKAGRSKAPETEPVKPVPEEHVYAIKPHVSRHIWAMIELQLLTGMRPGEVCAMRTGDIDTTGKVWIYKPAKHKTQHHGHTREIAIGPRAQQVLKPFLRTQLHEHVFQPAEAEAERREAMHKARQSPMTPSQRKRAEKAARRKRRSRAPTDRYDVAAYRRAIARGCQQAFHMPDEYRDPRSGTKAAKADTADAKKWRREKRRQWNREHIWSPNQLRHTAATRLRKEYGLEAAQVILGHATLTVTQVYAEKNIEAARKIMAEVG